MRTSTGSVATDLALHQRDVFGIRHLVDIDDHAERPAEAAVELGLDRPLDDVVVPAAIGDEIGDGADLEIVELGEAGEIVAPRHGAVVVHDFADHSRRVQSRETGDVDRGFGMTGADQDATVARHQREDMAGADDVVGALGRVDGDGNGARTIRGGDAGGHSFLSLDRYGEGGFLAGAVLARHQRQGQLLDPFPRQGQANQAAAVARHEGDRLRRCHLRRNDQIPFVLPALVVDEHEHAAVAGLLDDLRRRRHHVVKGHGLDTPATRR